MKSGKAKYLNFIWPSCIWSQHVYLDPNLPLVQEHTFVEEKDDALEDLHEAHVVVAVLLHLLNEGNLGAPRGGEWGEEGWVGAEVLEGLLSHQLLLLVPLNRVHQAVPRLTAHNTSYDTALKWLQHVTGRSPTFILLHSQTSKDKNLLVRRKLY